MTVIMHNALVDCSPTCRLLQQSAHEVGAFSAGFRYVPGGRSYRAADFRGATIWANTFLAAP
jgi:hypothetical protein